MTLENYSNADLMQEVERRLECPGILDATELWAEMLRMTSSYNLQVKIIRKSRAQAENKPSPDLDDLAVRNMIENVSEDYDGT